MPDQVGGDTGLKSNLLAQLDGPLQQLPGGPEPTGGALEQRQLLGLAAPVKRLTSPPNTARW
jgi:hypothetical protein